mgnify:CR=1 FL=1
MADKKNPKHKGTISVAPAPPTTKTLNLSTSKLSASRIKHLATDKVWRQNRFLDIILNEYQKEMLNGFTVSSNVMYFMLCSRRMGKTWILCAESLRQCLEHPGSRVLFLSTTTIQAEEICSQTFGPILENCPEDIKPVYKSKSNKYVFKNGSEIRVKGMDHSGADAVRGVKAHLIVFDEACFIRKLQESIDVVMPMVIATNGRILFGSTPPDSAGHDSVNVIRQCEMANALVKMDINVTKGVLYTQRQIDSFIKEAGGAESTVARREYFCEIVTETDLAIFPACSEEHMARNIVIPVNNKPKYSPDLYVSMDLGFRDLTVIIFGYWDFINAKLMIQEEVVFPKNKATTDAIASAVMRTEESLWDGLVPKKRISDIDPRLIADLQKISGIQFRATKKDNKEAQVNQTNLMFINSQIQIDPKCKVLIDHCKYGVWNEARTQYQRSNAMGHFDAVDALVYMVRNVDRHHRSTPGEQYMPEIQTIHGEYKEPEDNNSVDALKQLFMRRK